MNRIDPSTDKASETNSGERAHANKPSDGRHGGLVLGTFTATTFLSAVLLFSMQPMFAKMVLPVLGGSTSVWAVALCFFQAALLAGYCLAYLLTRLMPVRDTGWVHIGLYLAASIALPIGLPSRWTDPPTDAPYLWQLGLFTVAIGLPYLAIAANAPLLQAWFAITGHPQRRDPYFLYAASNLGSLIALLGYPLVLEPVFGLRALSRLWAGGFVLLTLWLALSFWLTRKARADVETLSVAPALASDILPPSWSQRLGWVGLALVPSGLLTAFTTHITTDVAAAPLLWVMPLALYLLSFVLVFRERSLIPLRLLLLLHLGAVVYALLVLSQTKHESWFITSSAGVMAFFLTAMVAHRTLYQARPGPRYLTEFYLWMALGGALGGLSAALIAPKVFSEVFEYPLLLALSMACRPDALRLNLNNRNDWLILWLIIAAGILTIYWVPWAADKFDLYLYEWGTTPLVAAILAVLVLANLHRPHRQLVAAMMVFLAIVWLPSGVRRGEAQRSYFGIYRVMVSSDGDYNILMHGTTLHGAQRIRDEDGNPVVDTTPATYYHKAGPMARAIQLTRETLAAEGRKGRYGIIGLGTGSLACYAAAGESWRFFEIDPTVVGIAADASKFSFLANCMPQPDIVLGDARLTLAKEADGAFDLVVIDAFTSDAIPVHLMTAEAMQLYVAKTGPNGVALLHISNRYLDLESVAAATSSLVPGLQGFIVSDDSSDGTYAASTSTVVLITKNAAALEPFRQLADLKEFEAGTQRPWTDDYSDILGPFLSRLYP
jgi:hypothetical protein